MNRVVSFASLLASAVVMAPCGHQAASVVPSTAFAHERSAPAIHANCGSVPVGYARCFSFARTDSIAQSLPDQAGFGRADLQSAYKLPSATAGSDQAVGIVDAYNDATAESDLHFYRSQFGPPSCTTAKGCFMKVNQRGLPQLLPKLDSGWAAEISLDLDMVSAVCPNCRILLVEADNSSATNLGKSVDTSAMLGANVISTSFGMSESGSKRFEKHCHHPGHMITAAIGDGGFGASFPGSSPDVTAVGGTTLARANNGRGRRDSL